MQKMLIAIDPGWSGAIAFSYDNKVFVERMPQSAFGIFVALKNMQEMADGEMMPVEWMLEKVHAMPRDGKVSAWSFAENVGIIKGVLAGLLLNDDRIEKMQVDPRSWQNKIPNLPSSKFEKTGDKKEDEKAARKKKQERKNFLRDFAQEKYPHLSVNLKNGDALCMLWTMTQP